MLKRSNKIAPTANFVTKDKLSTNSITKTQCTRRRVFQWHWGVENVIHVYNWTQLAMLST